MSNSNELKNSVSQSNRSCKQTPIYLNIYSFSSCCNAVFGSLGLGLYHTAIEAFGLEYMFQGFSGEMTGVVELYPKTCPYKFEEQVLLGYTSYSFNEFQDNVVEPLCYEFISNRYDLLNNNCNHFALRMAEMLGVADRHPRGYIFRVTNFFNLMRCCIPKCILSGRLDWFQQPDAENSLQHSMMHYHELVEQPQFYFKEQSVEDSSPIPIRSRTFSQSQIPKSELSQAPDLKMKSKQSSSISEGQQAQ